jgi:hypothetical protein
VHCAGRQVCGLGLGESSPRLNDSRLTGRAPVV